MNTKVLISLNETINSPSDGYQFPLEEGLSEKTKTALVAETQRLQDDMVNSKVEEIRSDTERRYRQRMEEAEKDHQRQLAEEREAREKADKEAKKAAEAARVKALADAEEERKALLEQFNELNDQLKAKNKEELDLHDKIRKLQLAANEAELEATKKANAEIMKARSEIAEQEAEKQQLALAEKEKQLADARKANDDLRRKLDQSSQQLKGHVMEEAIKETVTEAFPDDVIEVVKTGQHGADILQRVRTSQKGECGTVLLEIKNAEIWQKDWLKRLAENQLASGADIAVLITKTMPGGSDEPFIQDGAIWIVKYQYATVAIHLLRQILLEGARQRSVQTGRDEKAEKLYDFLCSRQFALYMRNLMQSCSNLGANIQQEQRGHDKGVEAAPT